MAANKATAPPLRNTPEGQRLIVQAEVVAHMTVSQAAKQLAQGTEVRKAWVRPNRNPVGSVRLVSARVMSDLLLVEYRSGSTKAGKRQTIIVIGCSLTTASGKTTLMLETDKGPLQLSPGTPQHMTLWALGINAMLHLAEQQDKLDQSEALMDLPWHGRAGKEP